MNRETLTLSAPHDFAAGNVLTFYNPTTGKKQTVCRVLLVPAPNKLIVQHLCWYQRIWPWITGNFWSLVWRLKRAIV